MEKEEGHLAEHPGTTTHVEAPETYELTSEDFDWAEKHWHGKKIGVVSQKLLTWGVEARGVLKTIRCDAFCI